MSDAICFLESADFNYLLFNFRVKITRFDFFELRRALLLLWKLLQTSGEHSPDNFDIILAILTVSWKCLHYLGNVDIICDQNDPENRPCFASFKNQVNYDGQLFHLILKICGWLLSQQCKVVPIGTFRSSCSSWCLVVTMLVKIKITLMDDKQVHKNKHQKKKSKGKKKKKKGGRSENHHHHVDNSLICIIL